MIELTERAREVLRRASEAARRFQPDVRIRLRAEGGSVVFSLADVAADDEIAIEIDDVPLVVQRGLEGVIDAGDHDRLELRSRPGTGPEPD